MTCRAIASAILVATFALAACDGGGGEAAPSTSLPATVAIDTASSADVDSPAAFRSSIPGPTRGLTFRWEFGDGTTSDLEAPTHQYAKAGAFSVSVTVTDAAGATRTATSTVTLSRGAVVSGLVCSGASNAGWCWQRPTPIGDRLTELFFLDGLLGWAVTDDGNILKTRDGGATWVAQASPATRALKHIRFVDASNGWAVDNLGALLHTGDGGDTWTRQDSGMTTVCYTVTGAFGRPVGYTCSPEKVVNFVVANAATAFLYSSVDYLSSYKPFRSTVDGGLHWEETNYFPSAMTPNGTAWVTDGCEVSSSVDGGKTLMPSYPCAQGVGVSSLLFADDVRGWFFARRNAGGSNSLFRTIDGGASWQAVALAGSYLSEGSYPRLLQMGRDGRGWLVGSRMPYWTDNGGDSWTAALFPADWQAVDATTLVGRVPDGDYLTRDRGQTVKLIGQVAAEASGQPSTIQVAANSVWRHYADRSYRSTDDGSTWPRVFGPYAEDANSKLTATWFFDGKRGLAYSAGGRVYETGDSGRSWKLKSSTNNVWGLGARIQFVSETTGWVTSNTNGLLRTTDGGAFWESLPDAFQYRRGLPVDVHFLDANRGWMLSGGALQSTVDGGRTWAIVLDALPFAAYGVRFASASVGVMVGEAGQIARTTDGGITWSSPASRTFSNLRRVIFSSATTAWAVGDSGAITTSADGGLTWLRVDGPSTASLKDVHAVDAEHGWAVGSDGAILATADAGRTWQVQRSPSKKDLTSVFLVDSRTGWVAGPDGTVLATSTGGQ